MNTYPPISDYALIGDCHGGALVSRDGSIDWCAFHRFVAGPVFSRILDWERGGHFRIAPRDDYDVTRRYLPSTNVLETTFETTTGTIVLTDCFVVQPNGGHPEHRLIRLVECTQGEVPVRVEFSPRFDYGLTAPRLEVLDRELAVVYGSDGFALLQAVYHPDAPGWLRELPAVGVLRVVLLHNYTRTVTGDGREVVGRREADTDGLPPGHLRLTSPYDLDARWGVKRDSFWNGYKAHLTETCEVPDRDLTGAKDGEQAQRPNLVTNVATTDATVADAKMTEKIHQQLADRGLLPGDHYLDSGYPSAELLVGVQARYGVSLITPLLADTSPQARAASGFQAGAFTIDWDALQATCPQGQRSTSWNQATQHGHQAVVVKFAAGTCRPCPVREQCTTTKRGGRQLTVQPRGLHDALQAARAAQGTRHWQARYALRAGVEGTIRQAVAVTGMRRARYRGLAKTHLEHVYSAVALNLIRLDAWWNGHPLDRTRTSHLARLQLALAS